MDGKKKGSKKSIAKVAPLAAPLPPKEWTLFDPTALQDASRNKLSLGDIFEKKAAPKRIDNASDLINFVESEVC